MLRTYIRPMTEMEREALGEELLNANNNPHSLGEAIWCGIGYGILAFVASLFLAQLLRLWTSEIAWMSLLMSAFLAFGFIYGSMRSFKYQRQARKQHAALLAQRLVRREVEITEVSATAVIEAEPEDVIEEDRYTDSIFLFDIGNRQVLFLCGDHLVEMADDGEVDYVPYNAFDMVRYPDAPDEIVRIYPKGNPLPISRTLYWNDYETINELLDGEVLDGITLATIEQDRPDLFAACDKERGK